MEKYFQLDPSQQELLKQQIEKRNNNLNKFATKDNEAFRIDKSRSKSDLIRSSFVIDTDKILHNLFYNRYSDKTQVFSFYLNDDITRRSLHVQLVSRIARTIGQALNLNIDLIEAISLGHDIGHTPFGHKGEEFLNEKFYKNTKRYFTHNVHSVRVLQKITNSNLTLQTLDGILCHNGDKDFSHFEPSKIYGFEELNKRVEECCLDKEAINQMRPATLEGCVVRISDMVAYVGRDRQDAIKAKLRTDDDFDHIGILGKDNREIIKKMVSNIVKNSYGKNYLKIDDKVYSDFLALRNENNKIIYRNPKIDDVYNETIRHMLFGLYDTFIEDIDNKNYSSYIYRHHVNHPKLRGFYKDNKGELKINSDEVVVDYIASMTDDYFINLYETLFPKSKFKIQYRSYFR